MPRGVMHHFQIIFHHQLLHTLSFPTFINTLILQHFVAAITHFASNKILFKKYSSSLFFIVYFFHSFCCSRGGLSLSFSNPFFHLISVSLNFYTFNACPSQFYLSSFYHCPIFCSNLQLHSVYTCLNSLPITVDHPLLVFK